MARKLKERPYNAGTMTFAAFFGMIRSALRKQSMYWKPLQIVRNKAKIPYKGANKKRKWSYICEECKKEFKGTEVVVHHKKECGNLNSFSDIGDFCKRLFCEVDGLQLICDKCHAKKHKK